MKLSKRHYFSGGSLIRVALLLLSMSNLSWSRLPKQIRIVGIFDQGGDPRHEMGFRAAIDKINAKQDRNKDMELTLPYTTIEPETFQIPPGSR